MIDGLLRDIFDYQRFSPNSQLAELIAGTELRYRTALSDEDMELVSAAGAPELLPDRGGEKHGVH